MKNIRNTKKLQAALREKVKAIYDNGGKTFDRYRVYYKEHDNLNTLGEVDKSLWTYRGMSSNPTHPQGFGQIASGRLGKHNGKKISFFDLPLECQILVRNDIYDD